MGAVTFELETIGNDVNEEFNNLVEEAIHGYGNNPYNGTISTTSLGSEIELTNEIKKLFKNEDYDKLYRIFYPEKRYTQYTKETDHFKRYVPKWEDNREVVRRKKGVRTIKQYSLKPKKYLGPRIHKRYDSIGEAKRAAKKLSIEYGTSIEIVQHRSNGDTFRLGEMSLQTDGKKFRTQRTVKSAVYLPVYKFTFYVCAAE